MKEFIYAMHNIVLQLKIYNSAYGWQEREKSGLKNNYLEENRLNCEFWTQMSIIMIPTSHSRLLN